MEDDQPSTSIKSEITDKPEGTKGKSDNSKSFSWKLLVLILVFTLAGVAGGYSAANQKANKDLNAKNTEIAAKNQQISKQQQEIEQLKSQQNKTSEPEDTLSLDNVKENIKAAMESKNYGALEGYMADSVYVILAASEFAQNRTPAQAAENLKYFDTASNPWDFALSDTVLASYAEGDYSTYFPASAYVGRAESGEVVSFQFNDLGKISVIFISATDEIL